MLVLLPPSEAKTPGGDGPPVDLDALSFPELTAIRRTVGRALASLCRRSPRKARDLLGLSTALDADRAANAQLWTSPTLPAGRRYSGVLYDALGYPALPAAARRRADECLVTLSGLWGATRPTDLIPAYRIGIATMLPGRPSLPALWRPAMPAALDALVAEHGALDLRSTGYQDMYRPSPAAGAALVRVRMLDATGRRAAASYASKVAKGRLAAALLRRGMPSRNAAAQAAASIGLVADVTADAVEVRIPTAWP